MPAASGYWKSTEENATRGLMQAAEDERRERTDWHKRALDYYEGRQPKPLKVKPGQSDNNVIVNLVQLHADHTVSYAVPEFPTITPPNDDPDVAGLLNDFWAYQGGAIWLANLMLSGVLDGHCFVQIVPSNDPTIWPRLVALQPQNVTAYWPEDDPDTVLWYEVMYMSGRQKRRRDILAPGTDDNVRWQIREYILRGDGGRWEPAEVIDWPFDFPPILDWQHLPRFASYYGRHELQHIDLQNAVNKVASDIKSILRSHASPRLIGIGFAGNALQETAVDAFWTIPNTDAKVQLIEMGGDLASSMNYMQWLTNRYMELSRVTILSGGPDAYKGITNLGVRAAFVGQEAKTRTLHKQYGDSLALLTQWAFAVMGMLIELPVVKFERALPESDTEEAQAGALKLQMGVVSKQTISAELGYDWEEEAEKMQAEAEDSAGMMERLLREPMPQDMPTQDNNQEPQQ